MEKDNQDKGNKDKGNKDKGNQGETDQIENNQTESGLSTEVDDKDQSLMRESLQNYERHYSGPVFWRKLIKFSKTAGREVTEKALVLFYVAKSEQLPLWAKSMIFGALGYFIHTLDAVPDFVPLLGFADDLGILIGVAALLAKRVSPEIELRVDQKLSEWFETK